MTGLLRALAGDVVRLAGALAGEFGDALLCEDRRRLDALGRIFPDGLDARDDSR